MVNVVDRSLSASVVVSTSERAQLYACCFVLTAPHLPCKRENSFLSASESTDKINDYRVNLVLHLAVKGTNKFLWSW